MRRRDFIAGLGGAASWPVVVRAQRTDRVRRVGVLMNGAATEARAQAYVGAFTEALSKAGWVEGKNVSIEFRSADAHYDRLPSLAAELVDHNVSVILAYDLPSAFAAKAATRTIPIVFASGADPVKAGLVESFSRPNGNLTGGSVYFSVLGPKRVELLHELIPAVKTIALLGNPSNPNFQLDTPDIRAAADALAQSLEVLPASTEGELEAAFSTMIQRRIGALIVTPDPFFMSRRKQLVELAARHTMPAIYPSRVFVDAGGLISCGPAKYMNARGIRWEEFSRALSRLSF